MRRVLTVSCLMALSGCGIPVAALPYAIGAAGGVIVQTEKLDVSLIDAYLSLHGLKSGPIPASPAIDTLSAAH